MRGGVPFYTSTVSCLSVFKKNFSGAVFQSVLKESSLGIGTVNFILPNENIKMLKARSRNTESAGKG